jgi:hypothetical protein
MRKSELIQAEEMNRDREKLRITLVEVVKIDMSIKVTKSMIVDMVE